MEAFELRLWDGRLGRWLTVDPYGEFFSPYIGMGNNPISLTDPDGGSTEDPPVGWHAPMSYPVEPTMLNDVVIQNFNVRGPKGSMVLKGIEWNPAQFRLDNTLSLWMPNNLNINSVISVNEWISQFTQPRPNVACKRTCDLIAGPAPIGRAINVASENGDKIIPTNNFQVGINTIDTYLSQGRPITVGVHHKFNAGYNEGTTDHYIVIVGRGTTSGQVYYRFFDVATRHRNLGTSPSNRLYINGNSATGNTAYTRRRTYTLSQVRPN